MTATTYLFSGLQPFWNYDSFSIASRQIGGGTGLINTAGGKWTISEGVVTVDEGMNLIFSTTDLILKFHNNSPSIGRVYNSIERHHDGSGSSTDSLRRHMGLMGRHWIFNYERCIIADDLGANAVEVGSTGERNAWGNSGTGGFYNSVPGVQKILRYDSTDYFEITTPDYTTCKFSHPDPSNKDYVPGSVSRCYYHLESIIDKNGVGIYVEWERAEHWLCRRKQQSDLSIQNQASIGLDRWRAEENPVHSFCLYVISRHNQ